jgi:V/A-type H+/Na+-transporting ATPase subunit C
MTERLSKYAFINAKLRARISKILSPEVFNELARASSLESMLTMLRETCFSELETAYSATGDLKQVEFKLIEYEIGLYRELKRHVHRDTVEFLDALLVRYEIDNLKNAIRVFFDRMVRGRPIDPGSEYILYEPIIHAIPIDKILYAESFDEIVVLLEGTGYEAIIRGHIEKVKQDSSLFRLEIALDHLYYAGLLSSAGRLSRQDRRIVYRLIGAEIDTENISWIVRLKKFHDISRELLEASIIPGGTVVKASLTEKLCQEDTVATVLGDIIEGHYSEYTTLLSQATGSTSGLVLIGRILEEIRQQEIRRILTGDPFTIGIIVVYFLLKRKELSTLRRLLTAKQYGREPNTIESMI